MSWRVVSATAIGSSHQANGTQCQDECWAMVDQWGDGAVLTAFVSDGAGSARRGGEGAALAIQTAVRFIGEALSEAGVPLDDSLAKACVDAIHAAIAEEASANDLMPRDYACTFLGVISRLGATLAFQIGDGGIVIDAGAGLELAIEPMSGEYANMTHFVTQDDRKAVLVSRQYSGHARRLGVFSDGLQRLALNLAEGKPHEPFFKPFFDVLSRISADQEEALQPQLAAFLQSKPVNERTDDDKSLALAVCTDGTDSAAVTADR